MIMAQAGFRQTADEPTGDVMHGDPDAVQALEGGEDGFGVHPGSIADDPMFPAADPATRRQRRA